MMRDRDRRARLLRECGAALPIVALLAFMLIGVLAVLGLDTSRVKSEGALLRRRVETLCRATARHSLTPERAIKVFQLYANAIELTRGTKITSVRLTMPFALNGDISNLTFDPDAANACQATDDPSAPDPYNPSSSGASPIPFADLRSDVLPNGLSINPYRCSNIRHFEDESVDCLLYPSVCSPSGEPNPNYPSSMWSDIVNAGNTIGCEVDASVPPLLPFLPTRPISAKSAWWIPLKTVAPYLEGGGPSSVTNADFPGLSIGIATELTTWAGELPSGARLGDDRFRFLDMDDPVLAQLDPRRAIPPGFIRQRFTFENSERVFDSTFSVPSIPKLANESEGDSDAQHEMLTACLNPLVLGRNLLLSTLVEYASRSGQTRSMTEIAHINPRHFGSNPPVNRPVVMVPFGADLLTPRFQAPFVTYNSGGTFDKGGFITPWRDFGSPEQSRHQALIAQQVRACYHLFIDNDQTSSILFLPSPLGQGFNPLLPPQMRLYTYNLHQNFGLPTNWDYSVPWATNLPSDNGRLLTAPELIYSLGSTQACPIDRNVTSDSSLSRNCKKSDIGPFEDLLPDIEGYLEYQARGEARAYPSPGLSPPRRGNGSIITPSNGGEAQPDIGTPQIERTSVDTKIPRSAVVVVTHKPLPPERVNRMSELVQELNNAARPVIVIYLPATHTDSGYFANYCEALGLGSDCSNDGNPSPNTFIFLSPFNSAYGQRYTHNIEGAPRAEDAVFQKYWADLLLDDPLYTDDPYYLDIARTLFIDTISKLEPKL